MSDEVEVKAEETTTKTTRPKQRSTRASKDSRPTRVPVSGFRNILTVEGMDPAFKYRWVSDVNESGERIFRHLQAGYDFVHLEEINGVGQDRVGNASDLSSLVTKPAGGASPEGRPLFLYLMKVPKEYYEEDQNRKVEDSVQAEKRMLEDAASDSGTYGEIKISR